MKYAIKIILATLLVPLFFACIKSKEADTKRIYTKEIERIFTSDFEEDLIDKAEKYYPPRDEVIEITSSENSSLPETKYWYYDSFDGVRIPYCITIDAIEYYSDLIDELNANKEANFFLSAEFKYKAKVEFKETFSPPTENKSVSADPFIYTKVFVVEMQLNWMNYCGSLCALWIDKERIAVFSESGELLQVFLDGVDPVAVS